MQFGSARIVSQNFHIWKRFPCTRSFPYRWQKCIPLWFCKHLFKRKTTVNLKWFSQKGRGKAEKNYKHREKILISSQFPNLINIHLPTITENNPWDSSVFEREVTVKRNIYISIHIYVGMCAYFSKTMFQKGQSLFKKKIKVGLNY